ncbi:Hypothetical protein NGAL_HAMBI2605_10300 [Neorhizobium galegae bv. orientalis]|nr:Hypothetical protein NGAL_HAMBI2605_10300 [Neorhizobium galegae bv. orientalis]
MQKTTDFTPLGLEACGSVSPSVASTLGKRYCTLRLCLNEGVLMTPEFFNSWLLQAVLVACALCGVSVLILSVRTGWIGRTVTWAIVSLAVLGAMMVLSPRWTKFAFEWGELKAELAALKNERESLVASNSKLTAQIAEVSKLSTAKFTSAQDVFSSIQKTRQNVSWADFLPATSASYRVEATDSAALNKVISDAVKSNPTNVTKALETMGFKVLQPATAGDLRAAPPDALWVTPGKFVVSPPGQK